MSRFRKALIVTLGIAVLAVPTAAFAGQGEGHGKSDGKAKNGKSKGKAKGCGSSGKAKRRKVAYVFKGFYAGEGMVEVKRGNAHVRRGGFIGETVEFDLSETRIGTADVNGDGERNLDDVEAGDWVLVLSRLRCKTPGEQPFEAKRLVDKTSRHKVA